MSSDPTWSEYSNPLGSFSPEEIRLFARLNRIQATERFKAWKESDEQLQELIRQSPFKTEDELFKYLEDKRGRNQPPPQPPKTEEPPAKKSPAKKKKRDMDRTVQLRIFGRALVQEEPPPDIAERFETTAATVNSIVKRFKSDINKAFQDEDNPRTSIELAREYRVPEEIILRVVLEAEKEYNARHDLPLPLT